MQRFAIILMLLTEGAALGAPSVEALKRGEYIFHSAGGCSCHIDPDNDDGSLSGGRAIKTPFGTYYSTNISPHSEFGLGKWQASDFYNAMSNGKSPKGENYFPVFPYTSFSKMTRQDVDDLWVYLKTLKPSPKKNKKHDVPFPFNIRLSVTPWRWLYFRSSEFKPDPNQSPEWNRGSYLVNGPGHCGECHTRRNFMGAGVIEDFLAGTENGPDSEPVSNITPHEEGLKDWSVVDISYYLSTGMTPDGDFAGKGMAELIKHGYKHLNENDLQDIATYLKSLPGRKSP